ncbi:peptide deformylase [Candidatus Azoamicus ciliaticola]|uniref:Peptide deformylase n=1 Tax=Candidatus Azoamicus ciliaticola TaxID=2652803 RepID=A0A6J5JWA7_9GAMM|nr:peptide deformylase [Candidatus Azoamicus ciliaticola]CAB3976245.1 Peptide deformylase 1 [Candidatus Azoamicus ciliaticola]
MAILEILKYPHTNLKKKVEKINIINNNIINITNSMIETMIHNNGIGLAAPQVNINKQIIVISINEKIKPLILINPIIILKKGITTNTEGCLSFPDVFVKVKRNKIIKVIFFDLNGKKNLFLADNLLSICIQHEIDHLNGITLYDKMSTLKKKLIQK